MERRLQTRRILPDLWAKFFYLEELTQNEWSISQKSKTSEEPMKPIFNYCFEIDTSIKSRLFKLIRLSVAYTTTYDKEHNSKVHFGNFCFNLLVVE